MFKTSKWAHGHISYQVQFDIFFSVELFSLFVSELVDRFQPENRFTSWKKIRFRKLKKHLLRPITRPVKIVTSETQIILYSVHRPKSLTK